VTKVWDTLAPYFISDLEPTWSSAVRVRGPWSATGWTLFEITAIVVVSFLRIPMLSPSNKQLAQLAALVVAWNIGCWLVADVSELSEIESADETSRELSL